VCGPYDYAGNVNSNGYNTYVQNNCWADPQCPQTVSANNPGDWMVSANECCDGSVRTAPLNAQQMDNWRADLRTWGSCGAPPATCTDTPISALASLTSTYAESMPHNSQTIAQSAWDVWLNNDGSSPNEVMIWVDINGRCNAGSFRVSQHAPVTVAGQTWQPNQYGSGEFIWVLGGDGACAQQSSGTVDILALLRWMQGHGFTAAGATIGLIQFGWEICSTGGGPETFRVSSYSVKAS
jgi:hypothetical protein